MQTSISFFCLLSYLLCLSAWLLYLHYLLNGMEYSSPSILLPRPTLLNIHLFEGIILNRNSHIALNKKEAAKYLREVAKFPEV